jgi:hypothetical protein
LRPGAREEEKKKEVLIQVPQAGDDTEDCGGPRRQT